ncbi:uncharacterized protein EMH_0017190 [Eimeria mitis]|uniref:Uncharacterized protein n=1 Tax=Eimeria mitis TaxID=44415 RepID=U6KBV0_9EIME|nr:uncharacterized protein EMH_0017190 [Eimeria mitis]CDJ33722.1 hypothetical protein, conserved [Eimeria mitis]
MSRLRSRGRTRRPHFLFVGLSLFLLSFLAGAFAAHPDDGGAGEVETVELEQPATVEQERSHASPYSRAATAGQRPESPRFSSSPRSPTSVASPSRDAAESFIALIAAFDTSAVFDLSSGGTRRTSPYGRISGSTTSPATARQAVRLLKRQLGDGDSAVQVQVLQEWLDERLLEGRIPREELMKAVIAVTGGGHKFVDRTVPSTRTDLLRRTATQRDGDSAVQVQVLQQWLDERLSERRIPPDLRRLAREVKSDPTLIRHQGASGSEPKSELQRESRVFEQPESRTPSPLSEMSISPEPREMPDVPEALEERSEPKSELQRESRVFEQPESRTPSPLSEMSISPEPREIPDVPGAFEEREVPQPGSVFEEQSVAPEPVESPEPSDTREKLTLDLKPPVSEGSTPEVSPDFEQFHIPESGWLSELEKLLNAPSPSTPSPISEDAPLFSPETQRLLDAIPPLPGRPIPGSTKELLEYSPYVGVAPKWKPSLEEESIGSMSPLSLPPRTQDGGVDQLTKEVDDIIAALQQPSESEEMPSTPDIEEQPTVERLQASSPESREASADEGTRGRRESARGGDMSLSTDVWQKRMRLWDMTKAAANEHKTMLKVTGGLLIGALLIGGLVMLHRRMRPRIPISSPLISRVESKDCHVFVDFGKGKKLKGMGDVVRIDGVRVNNAKRTLTVEYVERPAFKASRGRELFKWLKYYGTVGKSLVRRVETMSFPESCMAGPFSRFQVAEAGGSVSRLMVDLDYNPGPLAVPREVMDEDQLDELLANYGQETSWKLYDDCVMHIRVDTPFRGSPLVAVDTARGRVGFLNEELEHLSSPLPKECDWREPSRVRIAYKSTTNGDPVDVLLMMSAADPPIEETMVLEREPVDAALEDPDEILEDIRTLFEE